MTKEEFETRFIDDLSCAEYMRKRLESDDMVCPECGSSAFYFNSFGRRWQCNKCGKTKGLTSETVMAYSKFPLKHWITAIYRMSENKPLLAKDLQAELGEHTPNHVRVMMLRIRSAMSQYLKENGIRRRLPATEMTVLRAEHHGVHDENLELYRDERIYKKATGDVEDKFNFLLDICLTHKTDVKLNR